MTHLIISAHPSSGSFTNYLAARLAEGYESAGLSVVWRNLYEGEFKSILDGEDLKALKSGETPFDIEAEQELIRQSDLITVIYPLWWASFPAVLKGYIDRVFSNGFAFKYSRDGAKGLLTGKKVLIHTTMGNSIKEYEEKGLLEAFKAIQGGEVFGYCGMEIVDHRFYPEIVSADQLKRDEYLEQALQLYPIPVAGLKEL
ncbi:MAG: NAD(P)H-dependent oxidoreductase [Bacteroidales bacterium]|jgi:NAD(P)H dehydrogenase (quinone)|nr:NAD(P)H-dependent oxidoreductase [Bacteroidales bacterium]